MSPMEAASQSYEGSASWALHVAVVKWGSCLFCLLTVCVCVCVIFKARKGLVAISRLRATLTRDVQSGIVYLPCIGATDTAFVFLNFLSLLRCQQFIYPFTDHAAPRVQAAQCCWARPWQFGWTSVEAGGGGCFWKTPSIQAACFVYQ